MRRSMSTSTGTLTGSSIGPGLFVLGLWLLVCTVAGISFAQEGSDLPLGDEQAVAFAKAQVEVNRIYSTADGVSGTSLIEIKPDALPKDVLKDMVRAIEAQGLTLDDYNALMEAYRSDERFRSRVVAATVELM